MCGFLTRPTFFSVAMLTLKTTCFEDLIILVKFLKCTVWVAVSKSGIIGPSWFQDEEEKSVTVTTEQYLKVIQKLFGASARKRYIDVKAVQWFQQDGATPQTSIRSIHWLQKNFRKKIISRKKKDSSSELYR